MNASAVTCPQCQAAPSEPCRKTDGSTRQSYHLRRRIAAERVR